MNTHRFLSLTPFLALAALLATSASSLADRRRITVYQDNDGDGHFHRKRIEVPDRRFRGVSDCGPGFRFGRPNPFLLGGPAFGFGFTRSFVTPRYYSAPRYYGHDCSDDLAVEVQRELRRRGYYYGPIDGDVGPGTRAAIFAYQADRCLPRTGRIDRSLLRALGIG